MDKVKAVKAQLRLQQWAERISECQASSMTVVAWCEAHDINICFLQVQIPEICRQKWRILHLRFGESCRLPGRIA